MANPPGVDRTDVLAVHQAMTRLKAMNPRQCRIVEMLIVDGLTVADVAAVLLISERTVHREWKVARAWLARTLQDWR